MLKCHEVNLQAYCNNKMSSILFEGKTDAEYDTDS